MSSDPLATIIALLRPRTVFAKLISGAGRWAVRYERSEDPGFCIVLEGSCVIVADGAGAFELAAGDFFLLPRTPSFTMSSEPGVRATRVAPTDVRELRHGARAGPPTMRMLGGYFHVDRANAPLLARLLPPVVHVRRDEPGASRLRRLVELIGDEAEADRAGRELILARLVEVLLVEALRVRRAAADGQERSLLAGLGDPGLTRALQRLHDDLARRWTVAELARAAGMSRAVFAERFARKVGLPPMQYLLEWRMAVAKDAILRERPPLAEVAERVGYRSASAFSTAFTRLTGRPPSALAHARR